MKIWKRLQVMWMCMPHMNRSVMRVTSLRVRDKHFDVGDSVIVLTPDYNFSRKYVGLVQL